MEPPMIEVKNLGKKYRITHQQGGYIALRDVIANTFKDPLGFAKRKAKNVLGYKTKEDFWAIRDVCFEVKKGEVIGIIGRNGAGKSTLLKILTGITPPTEGTATLRGRVASLLEVGTGFHPELTGRENIFLNGAIIGMSKKEIVEKFDQIVEFAGIGKFLDTPVKRYSSGMYVRLAFSVAAHMEPDVLLVDEVLAVGDADFQKKCLGKMEEVTKTSGRTIIFVSHNMGAIQTLCKRSILLENGQVKMIGETSKVVDYYLSYTNSLSAIPVRDRKDRKGTQDLKITACYLRDENGNRTNQVVCGEDATLVFEYECKPTAELDNVTIGANISNKDDVSLTLLHNSMTKADFGTVTGKGMFVCELKKIPLVAGTYHIDARVTSHLVEVDALENIFKFDVLPGDFFGTGASIQHSQMYLDQKWAKEIKK